jgi:hypothetical protein
LGGEHQRVEAIFPAVPPEQAEQTLEALIILRARRVLEFLDPLAVIPTAVALMALFRYEVGEVLAESLL